MKFSKYNPKISNYLKFEFHGIRGRLAPKGSTIAQTSELLMHYFFLGIIDQSSSFYIQFFFYLRCTWREGDKERETITSYRLADWVQSSPHIRIYNQIFEFASTEVHIKFHGIWFFFFFDKHGIWCIRDYIFVISTILLIFVKFNIVYEIQYHFEHYCQHYLVPVIILSK